MSKLSGHYSITVAAIEGLRDDCLMHTTMRNLPEKELGDKFPSEGRMRGEGVITYHNQLKHPDWKPIEHPAAAAVLRDIKDVFNRGHWKDEGQKHHFMRNLHAEQSELQAYEAAKAWIKENALKSAKALNRRIVDKMGERAQTFGLQEFQPGFRISTCPLIPEPIELAYGDASKPGAIALQQENLFLNEPAEFLGYALHALQDSFSPSHVKRDAKEPYAITRILQYAGEEKKHHDEHDDAWRESLDGQTESFSELGKRAVQASRDLIIVVLNSALGNLDSPVDQLRGWDKFVTTWLAISSRLFGIKPNPQTVVPLNLPL